MQEVWKFYKETKSKYGHRIYEVSNLGRVKLNGKLYICPIRKDGYYYLCNKPLHRIVAELFIPGWDEKFEIDHKDRNRLNNMITNLLICFNHSQNINNPLTIQYKIENSHKKPVLQYTLDNKFVKEYVSIREAARQTKINKGNIIQCCKNRRYKSAGGYIWKYKK